MGLVALLDGTLVESDSEAWRHLCEARAISRLPSLALRRSWLEDIAFKRGNAEADRLRKTIADIWEKERQ
jgi:uncharacterized protein YjeT (DUF2065 family)